MAAQIAERVSETFCFAKKIPMLQKATSDDDNPTPGYIYQEINSITYESINSCNSLLDYLVGRLKKQSPYIKYKVLKILCYLASNGHSEFRSGLRHKSDVLRESESFTGQMDYLKGDAPNQRVRAVASELIGLLFNVESCGTSTIHAMTGPTGKKMEGFGNSPSQPTKNKTWLDSMKHLAERLPDAANLLKFKNDQENMPTTGGSSIAFVNFTESLNADPDSKRFLDDDESFQISENEESTESGNTLSVEVHLVDKITSQGGIRAVPSKEDLIQFSKRCSALNMDKVLAALNNRLLEPLTEVKLKSLHVLDHLLKSDIPDVGTRMSHCCTNLQEIATTESGNVLSKATKILSIIKAKMEKEKNKQDAQKAVKNSEMSRAPHSQDILKLENVGDTESLSSQQFAMDDTPTLFSGMSLHSQTENSTRIKQFETPDTVLKNPQHSSQDLDVFQGLDLSGGNRLPENDNSSRKSSQSSKSDLDNLFCVTQEATRPISVMQSQEPVQSCVTDIFDPLCSASVNSARQHVMQLGVTPTTGFEKESFNTKTTNSKKGTHSPQLIKHENRLISPLGNSSNANAASPGISGFTGSNFTGSGFTCSGLTGSGFTGSIHGSLNSASGSNTFGDLEGLSRNRTMQLNVTLPGNAFPMTNPYSSNFPNTSHPIVHPSVLSGGSTIPLRLPPPSQGRDFDFVGKSGKADAFSFVQDEMKEKKR